MSRKFYEVVKQDKICKSCKVEKPYTEYNRCKYTKGGLKHKCRECMTEYSRTYAKVNKERHKETPESKQCKDCGEVKYITEFPKDNSSKDGYRKSCKMCKSNKQREYVDKNREEVNRKKREDYQEKAEYYRLVKREYYTKNKDKVKATSAVRRTKLKNQPEWISNHHSEIRDIHRERLRISTEDIEYQVDHIIPIINKDICGLHVPWNMQIITKSENLLKKNDFDGTYSNESWRSKL